MGNLNGSNDDVATAWKLQAGQFNLVHTQPGLIRKEPGHGELAVIAGLMADEILLDKVHDLSDLELAALICLVAQEHCIIDTEPSGLDDLVQELELVPFDRSYGSALLLTLFR